MTTCQKVLLKFFKLHFKSFVSSYSDLEENGSQIWCLSCPASWLSWFPLFIHTQIYRVHSALDKDLVCETLTFQILGMTY